MLEEKRFFVISKMLKICRIHRGLIESRVGQMDIPITAHRALMYIARKERIESQKELAGHLEITPAAVTGVLQRLETDGYIERKLGCDNRFNEIIITDKGRQTVELSRDLFRELDAEISDGFSDGELELFLSFLDRIKENAEKCQIKNADKKETL